MGGVASVEAEFQLLWHDTEVVAGDVWEVVKLPLEILYNDVKMIQWAYGHPLVGLTGLVLGAGWGAVVLQDMPGDFAYIGPIIGAMSGIWAAYFGSVVLTGGTPPDWTLTYIPAGETVSEPIADFNDLIGYVAWAGCKPWQSNTSFLAGATVGWLVLPNFPMSLPALLGGVAGTILAYNLGSGRPATNPNPPASL